MRTIEEEFNRILIFMGIPICEIRNEASFTNDYQFDESKLTCLALYIGIFFRVNIKESEYPKMDTVGNAINLITEKLKSR